MDNKRIEWLDIAKGIGIFLVVVGHALTTSVRENSQVAMYLFNFVYFFHMPFLMFLSGYSYQISADRYEKIPFREFFVKKVKSLLVPYLCYAMIVYFIFSICGIVPKIGTIIKGVGYGNMDVLTFLKGLLIGDNFYSVHLWYIYVLFFFDLFVFILRKFKVKFIVFTFVGVGIYIFSFWNKLNLGTAYIHILTTFIWFSFGLNFRIKVNGVFSILCSINAILWYILKFTIVQYNNGSVLSETLNVLLQLCFIASFVGISQNLRGILKRYFLYLGKQSYQIYLFHQPFWGSCFGTLVYGVMGVPIIVTCMGSIVLSIFIPVIICICLSRITKLGRFFGLKRVDVIKS